MKTGLLPKVSETYTPFNPALEPQTAASVLLASDAECIKGAICDSCSFSFSFSFFCAENGNLCHPSGDYHFVGKGERRSGRVTRTARAHGSTYIR